VRFTLNIVALVLLVFGCSSFLQGIDLLPGNFIAGQIQSTVCGGLAIVAGAGLLIWANE
jgi:hypothetical protein